jgi:hypothetical protein
MRARRSIAPKDISFVWLGMDRGMLGLLDLHGRNGLCGRCCAAQGILEGR